LRKFVIIKQQPLIVYTRLLCSDIRCSQERRRKRSRKKQVDMNHTQDGIGHGHLSWKRTTYHYLGYLVTWDSVDTLRFLRECNILWNAH
jgi:hypothetical protein